MIFDLTSFVLGAITGGLFVACLAIPRVGLILAKSLAALLLAAGIGVLIWAIVQDLRGGTLTPIIWQQVVITQPGEAFGWGGGLVAAGLLALTFTLLRSSDRR